MINVIITHLIIYELGITLAVILMTINQIKHIDMKACQTNSQIAGGKLNKILLM